jgi:hypothetical protein
VGVVESITAVAHLVGPPRVEQPTQLRLGTKASVVAQPQIPSDLTGERDQVGISRLSDRTGRAQRCCGTGHTKGIGLDIATEEGNLCVDRRTLAEKTPLRIEESLREPNVRCCQGSQLPMVGVEQGGGLAQALQQSLLLGTERLEVRDSVAVGGPGLHVVTTMREQLVHCRTR